MFDPQSSVAPTDRTDRLRRGSHRRALAAIVGLATLLSTATGGVAVAQDGEPIVLTPTAVATKWLTPIPVPTKTLTPIVVKTLTPVPAPTYTLTPTTPKTLTPVAIPTYTRTPIAAPTYVLTPVTYTPVPDDPTPSATPLPDTSRPSGS